MSSFRTTLALFREQLLPVWCWMYPYMTRGGKIDRRFQAFGVGLSKTGTHSLAAALSNSCQTAHEVNRPPLRRSLTGIAAEKLFVIRTNEITQRIEELAAWLGCCGAMIDPEQTRQYVRKEKVDLAEFVDPGYLSAQIEFHCAPLERMLGLRTDERQQAHSQLVN